MKVYSFTRATAKELPTGRSVSSSLQQDKKKQDILQYHPQRSLEQAPKDSEVVITLCTTHYPFIYEAARCSCVMHSEIAKRCSVPLYLTAQWAHFTRAVVEEREETWRLSCWGIKRSSTHMKFKWVFCHTWLWTIFTLLTGRCLRRLNLTTSH